MKKLMTGMITVAMVAAMSTTAFAATITTEGGSQEIDVKAKYVDNTGTTDVYSVDVTWGAMEFTYTAAGALIWDPVKHEYEGSTTASWAASGNKVTATNHSNLAVNVGLAFAADAAYDQVTGSFDQDSLSLESAVDKAVSAADSKSAILTLAGTLPSTTETFTKVGTIQVTLQ